MRKVSVLFLCLFLGVVCLTTSSCKFDDDTTYEVYQFKMTNSVFYDSFDISVSNGYYRKISLTTTGHNNITARLGSSYKYEMNRTEMLEWCTNQGFGNSEGAEAISWLIEKDHGMIASASSNYTCCLLK